CWWSRPPSTVTNLLSAPFASIGNSPAILFPRLRPCASNGPPRACAGGLRRWNRQACGRSRAVPAETRRPCRQPLAVFVGSPLGRADPVGPRSRDAEIAQALPF